MHIEENVLPMSSNTCTDVPDRNTDREENQGNRVILRSSVKPKTTTLRIPHSDLSRAIRVFLASSSILHPPLESLW